MWCRTGYSRNTLVNKVKFDTDSAVKAGFNEASGAVVKD